MKFINEQTDLQFKVKWIKSTPNVKWKYLPVFFFKDEQDEKMQGYAYNIQHRHERMIIFEENLKYELLSYFKQYNNEWTEQAMLDWLKSNKNIVEKELAFRNAQYKTFGKLHHNLNKMVKSWSKSLHRITSFKDCYSAPNPYLIMYNWHKEMHSKE